MAVASQLEKEQAANKPKPAVNALDDDSSVAVFAAYMATGEGGETVDPAKIEAAEKKAEEDKKAAEELKELQNNDATSAFAGLIEAQSIETKAESYKGSAPEEKDDDDEEVKPKKKVALKKKAPAKKPVKISPKKKISIKPKIKKTDSAAVGTEESMDASTLKAIENSSNLPSTPEAATGAEDVKVPSKPKIVIKPKVKPASKVAHKVKKDDQAAAKKPEHKIAHKVKKNDDLPPEVKVRDDSLEVRSFKEEPKVEKDPDAPAADSNAAVSDQMAGGDLPADP